MRIDHQVIKRWLDFFYVVLFDNVIYFIIQIIKITHLSLSLTLSDVSSRVMVTLVIIGCMIDGRVNLYHGIFEQ